MANEKVPEVDILVDKPQQKLRSKKGHERRVNGAIYTVLTIISIVWLVPFVFLILQSFRSYATEYGGMVDYLMPKRFSLDNYRFLFEGSNFFAWWGKTLLIGAIVGLCQTAILTALRGLLDKYEGKGLTRALILCGALAAGFVVYLILAVTMQGFAFTAAKAPGKLIVSLVLYLAVGLIVSNLYLRHDNKLLATLPGFVAEGRLEGFKRMATLFVEIMAVCAAMLCVMTPMVTSQYIGWYGNTLIIALFVSVLQTIIQLSVSYALSRLRFKGRKLIMNTVLVLGLFPGFLTMITLYFLLKQLGLTQTGAVPGVILIYVASSGMGYYISKGFFDTIPKSLDESARIDGATRLQVFYKIIMPLAKPIVIYTILMAFMAPWGDYVFASYVAFGSEQNYNVAVGLYRWVNVNDYQGYFTRFCAGGVLVALPITALFLALQKYYVEGVTGGAVKG